jgi:lipopolysaccharide export system ATP-binding protein
MRKLQTCEISKSYSRRRVVDGVSVMVEQGEVVGLLGPNGAGKTTSFHIIVAWSARTPAVLVDDEEITHLPMYSGRAKASAICRRSPRLPQLTVEENLMAILETLPLDARERRERMHA